MLRSQQTGLTETERAAKKPRTLSIADQKSDNSGNLGPLCRLKTRGPIANTCTALLFWPLKARMLIASLCWIKPRGELRLISASPNLLEHISRSLESLRKSDRKVAQKILDDPNKATELKLADLAKLADVSEPTVIRFCSAIGCDGFQDMKIKLARSLAFGLSTSQVEISDDDDVETVVGKIFDFNLTSLDWVRSRLDPEALNAAVDVLHQAKRIHFIGLGASSIVAMDAQQKFPLFGVPCSAIVDAHQMLIAASMMDEGDVLVAISNSGSTKEVAQTARAAREHGAKTIGITGSRSPLLRFCDVGLLVETLENTDQYTPQISRVAALVIVDVLSTIVGFKKSSDHRLRVAEMKRFLADVRSTGIM